MVECKYTCFDRVLFLTKELPSNKKKEAVEIIQNDSFTELLDFCVKNNCLTQQQSHTIYEGIIMWEDLETNYYEEDREKYLIFLDKIGLDEDFVKSELEDN